MLLAHLRGLLKPDYSCGINSVIRESLICNGLSRELEGQTLHHRARVEAQLMDAGNYRAVLHSSIQYLFKGNAMQQMHNSRSMQAVPHIVENQDEIKRMTLALKVLKGTNFYDRMDQILKSVAAERRK